MEPRSLTNITDSFPIEYAEKRQQYETSIDSEYNIIRRIARFDNNDTEVTSDHEGGIDIVLRDARQAKPVGTPDINPVVEAHNALLRLLGCLRSIDYVLMNKSSKEAESNNAYNKARKSLYLRFKATEKMLIELGSSNLPLEKITKKIKKIEKDFNTELCGRLHQAGLDEECKTPDDYEKLLTHYRNLSALLDPAIPLRTISTIGNSTYTITQTPITKKTKAQREAIERDMLQAIESPRKEEENFQTIQLMGLQRANQHFSQLAAEDNRMLGAQTRKTHPHGLKNAFFVEEKVVNQNEEVVSLHESVRTASPVYIGKGMTDDERQAATDENKTQLEDFLNNRGILKPIFANSLVTNWDKGGEKKMIKHMTASFGNRYSNIPCNVIGLTYSSRIAPELPPTATVKQASDWNSRTERYTKAAQLSSDVEAVGGILLEHCASGQDRTGTVAAVRTRQQLDAISLLLDASPDQIDQALANSRNDAAINSHTVAGSRGLKHDSHTTGLFSKTTDQAMYLDSAKTNKKVKIEPEKLKEKLDMFAMIEKVASQFTPSLENKDKAMTGNFSSEARLHRQSKLISQFKTLCEGAALLGDKSINKIVSNVLKEPPKQIEDLNKNIATLLIALKKHPNKAEVAGILQNPVFRSNLDPFKPIQKVELEEKPRISGP